MKKIILFLSIVVLSGCAPGGMLATGEVHRLAIDGVSHTVQAMPGTSNGWAASKDDIWGGLIDPADYERNIRAIEKQTGCKVIKETVTNQGMRTTASVKC